jgi:sugar O-acyltransferase (sialic acid O-acetyltransferase NeuD family)
MDVVVVGAGGHGRVVLDLLRAEGKHRVLGFLDADDALAGTSVSGVPVLGHPANLLKLRGKARGAVLAVGDNRARANYARHFRDSGLELVTAIHPSAVIASGVSLGPGTVVCAHALVGVESTVGQACILNSHCVVEHECRLGDAVHICPGALLAGRVRVEAHAFIGLGAKVIQCLTVGPNAIIGAGATVIRDVPGDTTVVGTPAQTLRART